MKKVIPVLILFFYNFLFSQNTDYEVFNTSVNSKFAELGVTFLNDNSLIFASSKKDENDENFKKDRRLNNRQGYLEFYTGIKAENGDIIETGKFSNEIKNKFFEADISFTPNMKTVYFTWNNYYSIESKEDVEKWKTLHIVKATLNDTFETTDIVFLPFNSDSYSVRSPIVSNDGKKLFFVSDMPGGYGESDIYYVDIFEDGTYGNPINLGPNVNSSYSEQYPSLDSNSTLYFSTIGNLGMGGLDIFKSDFKNGAYEKAINLPEPINSKFDDFGYVYNSSSNSGYFISNRKEGVGNVDIYAFAPKELPCINNLVFNFINKNSKKQISNIDINLFIDNQIVQSINTRDNINYTSDLKCNTVYKISAEKDNYFPFETTININELTDTTVSKIFELTPMDCYQFLEVTLITKNKKIENGIVQLISNNEIIETKPTDLNGISQFKINCNTQYKLVASASNFENSEITFETSGLYNLELKKEINLIAKECNQQIIASIFNENNLPTNATISLYKNNQIIDKQIAMEANFNLSCTTNYKIIVEAENYENIEFEFTTDATYNKQLKEDFVLIKKECLQQIIASIYNENSVPTNAAISLYKNNQIIDKQIATEANFNLSCTTNYKIIVEVENYESAEFEFITDATYNKQLNKEFSLIPKVCNQTLTGNLMSNLNDLKIENSSVSLYSKGVLIEQLNTQNSLFNFNLNCNQNYKIVVDSENFETSQIEFQTLSENELNIEKTIVLVPKKCSQKIEILVFNDKSKQQLSNAKVSIYQDDALIEQKIIVNNNPLILNLDCNSNYKIIGESDNFDSSEIAFKTDFIFNKNSLQHLYLTPKPCNQNLNITVLNKDTKEPLLGSVITLTNNNTTLTTSNLQSTSSENIDLECGKVYNLKIELEKFDTQLIEFQTTNKYNDLLNKIIYLEPSIEYITLSGQKLINTNTIYFDLDKDDIRNDAATELNKVVSYLVNHPTVKIEVKSHTDSRAPDNYNLDLSNKRANSVMSYIISKGIDADRISGKGYGETQLVNKCSNGVKCTENEHQLNRRTEFLIIE